MTTGEVMTVTGLVRADTLGLVLPHEHLFCNTLREYRSDGLMNNEELVIRDLTRFASSGGGCIVDVTSAELGRDPEALRRVSLATGLPLVMGSGHYRDPYLDRGYFDRMSVDDLAQILVDEFRHGIGPNRVRPGIIGETGCDSSYVSATEERALRVAARAQLATGLAMTLHAARWPVARQMLPILQQEGVAADRIIVGHLDTVADREFHIELAARGHFVEFDGFSSTNEYDLSSGIDSIVAVVAAGFIDRVLISHDLFRTSHLPEYGGVGFSFIPTVVTAALLERGFSREQVFTITTTNPQAALSISTS